MLTVCEHHNVLRQAQDLLLELTTTSTIFRYTVFYDTTKKVDMLYFIRSMGLHFELVQELDE